jgi:RNA ligase (TIGR02306 family)
MERKLASIQLITDLQPIAGADVIVLAKVLGWELIALKKEFQVGDKCVFFEIDSILPLAPWNAHLVKDGKPLRVRTMRMRGKLSQGLALPLSLLPEGTYEVGQDVTELAGVTKYEPYIPPELVGRVKGTRPYFIPKTDEPRLQSAPDVLAELLALNVNVIGTVKMDGSSVTAYIKDRVFGVCSRNMELIETEDNAFWKTIRAEKIEEKMRAYFAPTENVAIQGELCGPGLQGNKMGLTKLEIHWYNLFSIDTGKYSAHKSLLSFVAHAQLNIVKVVFHNYMPSDTTVTSLLEKASALKYENGAPAEGIVWRPEIEVYSDVLKDRLSFKTISNSFLEKHKE